MERAYLRGEWYLRGDLRRQWFSPVGCSLPEEVTSGPACPWGALRVHYLPVKPQSATRRTVLFHVMRREGCAVACTGAGQALPSQASGGCGCSAARLLWPAERGRSSPVTQHVRRFACATPTFPFYSFTHPNHSCILPGEDDFEHFVFSLLSANTVKDYYVH